MSASPPTRWLAAPLLKAAFWGLVAGAAGVAAMTLAEKVEHYFTHRPDSYVPAHTLARLLGRPARPDAQRLGLNWNRHWGTGILVGAARGVMAAKSGRGAVGAGALRNTQAGLAFLVSGKQPGVKLSH